ncbi:hypothetical protein BTM25_36920 [Actinomadura rubteroloni]|uniref:Lipoprotein n=1 Tax=Actinomadura rubteroloni TaxID=1926885 RepID=A0A2P4UJ40_9ACTN|nr:hypothetical protein [Actinomadura rubteroloni]POM25050.1 hypothetical protein BTM25_36920 [Actinomadura rubteroloni]
MRTFTAALLAVLCGAAGCGGDSRLVAARTAHVRFGYPKGWQRQAGGAFTAVRVENGRTVARLTVLERPVAATTAALAVAALQAGRLIGRDYRRGPVQTVHVAHADSASRLSYSYLSDDRPRRPTEGTDVVAVRNRAVYVVRVTAVRGELPAADVDAIVKSVALKGD